MDIEPVKYYSNPGFPTRSVIDKRPELLQLMPKRWQGNAAVTTSLILALTIMAGWKVLADDTNNNQSNSRIAPVFVHGDSRATYGCVSVQGPVFLSEADAQDVIEDEARKAGIEFKKNVWMLRHVPLERTIQTDKKGEDNKIDLELHFDGTDKVRKIAYEYVCEEDLYNWELASDSGVKWSINTAKGAEILQKGLVESKPEGSFAVFYAPCALENVRGRKQTAKEVTSEELRKQVQDFITWLKTQGVI